MRDRAWAALLALAASAGCAVIKTTDVTDPGFKRHQSVAVLGWPVYTRVTDRDPASSTRLAVKAAGANQTEDVQAAVLFAEPIEPSLPLGERD